VGVTSVRLFERSYLAYNEHISINIQTNHPYLKLMTELNFVCSRSYINLDSYITDKGIN